MFWGMSFICEEYCVPAITVFCKRNNISDDVAGAIFIGTGLSLPVLFASFVGLFISHSAIGIGTVVGGNIFNHLINIAVSINSAPSRTLKLDPVIFTRETLFYLASCVLVIWTAKGNLQEAFTHMFMHAEWTSCLSIKWSEALVLVSCYFLYCAFDAKFSQLASCVSRLRCLKMRFSLDRRMYTQPSRSSDCASEAVEHNAEEPDCFDEHGSDRVQSAENQDSTLDSAPFSLRRRTLSVESTQNHHNLLDLEMASTSHRHMLQTPHEPVDLHSHLAELPQSILETTDTIAISMNDPVNLEDFTMFIRSSFFAAHAIGCIPHSRAWKMRYFTLDQSGLYYRLEYHQPRRGTHVRFIDIFDLDEVKVTNHLLFEFRIRLRDRQKMYYFRAMDQRAFQAVVDKLTDFLLDIKKRNEDDLRALCIKSMQEVSDGQDVLADPDNESIGDTFFVVPVALWPKVIYYVTLPLKALIYLTTPDVRKVGRENRAIVSVLICFAWLAVVTYILIEGLGVLAKLLGINGSIMGLTLGTWAASYPALWSSVVVARSGFGDMAVCNALGSNVFNNFIGLGLPWLVYVIVYNKPYSVLTDDGVVLSLVGLMVLMIATYFLIALTKWTLRPW
ncbi:hypothetical protein EON65_01755 [archaeon]|nr:MAG: hypothetical protein EON65_01755 [archaeon]